MSIRCPLRPVPLSCGNRTVQENLRESGNALRIGSSRRLGPHHQVLMHPRTLVSRHNTRWMLGVREFAHDMHHQTATKVGLLRLLDHTIKQMECAFRRGHFGHGFLQHFAPNVHSPLHVGGHKLVLATSANLTDAAQLTSFELGLHLSSATHADDVWDHFDRLIQQGLLQSVS